MGLNLNIKRVIFHSVLKVLKSEKGILENVYLSETSVKQISGRAGRSNSKYPHGEVTAWQSFDLAFIHAVMSKPNISPLKAAGLFPSVEQIEKFHNAHAELLKTTITKAKDDLNDKQNEDEDKDDIVLEPTQGEEYSEIEEVRLSSLLKQFLEFSKTSGHFFVSDPRTLIIVSNWLHTIPLSISEK